MKKILTIFVMLLWMVGTASAMSITAMDSASNLAQSLVGSGVAISNVTYTGATVASGYFSGGSAAGIGIDSGVVLTSGAASLLNGNSNTSDSITGSNGQPGDADLNALVGGSTQDATILEFDFVSDGDAAYFSYVFGSEEYNEYVDSAYNDVFAFFAGGQNVALIPGTNLPVTIDTVNPGDNAAYYNNNDPSEFSPSPFPFEYDGFTDVFTASVLNLTAGNTYHLKLAIADRGDMSLDSGVFLAAGSFSDVDPDVIPEPCTLAGFGLLLSLTGRTLRRRLRRA